MVEVAPGVKVTKKVYSGPINEQPFFGFVEKTPAMRAIDDAFVSGIIQAVGTREKAFEETALRGWKALALGNLPEAAKRFNQAFLLAPERSEVYHGLAAVVQTRFNDVEFAEELFKIAREQPDPLKNVNADYGRLLMIAKRPRDAQSVLEQADRQSRFWRRMVESRIRAITERRKDRCLRGCKRGGKTCHLHPCQLRPRAFQNAGSMRLRGLPAAQLQ